ncbi:hypothetical protein FISHEDRAFT_52291 [Fistulina hepatica ATCC 64428]|nr:hypothetical protein FISHEDRAFT_52291 [Fistulina hepatica ATCC 64428]
MHVLTSRLLTAEQIEPCVAGIRERVLHISRLPTILAQLKVPLRPLWKPACQALAAVAQNGHEDVVWKTIFTELKKVRPSDFNDGAPEISHIKDEAVGADDPWEEERTWRDPAAHKLRTVVSSWEELHPHDDEPEQNRFDASIYESQLLSALQECSSLSEKKNRELVGYFLAFVDEGTATVKNTLPRPVLNGYLALFASFKNAVVLYRANDLKALWKSLLSHPDREIKRSALKCVLTYGRQTRKSEAASEKLHTLLDDTRWRDELTGIDIASFADEQHDSDALDDTVDTFVRLLFGLMLERRRGATRRPAILGALGGLAEDNGLGIVVDLMLKGLGRRRGGSYDGQCHASPRQQLGFLTLLEDVLHHLGPHITHSWTDLLTATVDLVANAQRFIDSSKHATDFPDDEELHEVDEEVSEQEGFTKQDLRAVRTIRQAGIKRFTQFFRTPATFVDGESASFDFMPFVALAFEKFIRPRIPSLDTENTQAPSALLELFFTWSLDAKFSRYLADYDDKLLPKIYDCIIAVNVKAVVVLRVFDIVTNLLSHAEANATISNAMIRPHVSVLLRNLTVLTERMKTRTDESFSLTSTLGQRQISLLSRLSVYSTDRDQATTLLRLICPLLLKSTKLVPEKIKSDQLKIVETLIPLVPDLSKEQSPVFAEVYDILSTMFQSLRSRQARLIAVDSFSRLATVNPSLSCIAALIEALNAYSAKRVDQPDFDRRLLAFTDLNETTYRDLAPREWRPIVCNMLHFIQDPEELAIRTNASYSMKRFLDVLAGKRDDARFADYEALFKRILYPGLKNGLRSKNELVRAELLSVLAYSVSTCGDIIPMLSGMRVLLANGDEEANFFNNVLHVQTHRRSRALRRLGDFCDEEQLKSTTLSQIFVPLVANFIAPSGVDHHLVNDAIIAIGRMARHLSWSAYRSLVQTYLKLSRGQREAEKVYVRTLVAILESFHFSMDDVVPDAVDADEVDDRDEVNEADNRADALKASVKISETVNKRLLPTLIDSLETRDSSVEDHSRIPIAVGIVSVAKHLPASMREPQITRLLTVVSQILRSKSQDTRDLARDTLLRLAVLLGSDYLPLMLQELRSALVRGPQLHILAHVTHSLLVHVTSDKYVDGFSNLDKCVDDVAHVSAEVIFGESGNDVQSEGFRTTVHEVRGSSSKSLDSFAIMARFVTPARISGLLAPLRSIMQTTETLKVMQQVEEVLKRISTGLNANKHLLPADLLVLCNTLITQNSKFLKQAPKRKRKPVKQDVIVRTKRDASVNVNHYEKNSFRFVVFGLDLLQTALRRNRFDFHEQAIISRLQAIISTVGNTLYATNASILKSGMRVAASLSKCPLPSLSYSLPVFVQQMLDIIKQIGNTDSEVVQVAFRSLATVLRDGPSVDVKEKDLVYLLELLTPDLEEPSRQGAIFAMLRAIVSRKFVVSEIYDIMQRVSEIMVTSQSNVQELCRGVLLQFLLDYPQGKGRLKNQMVFLAKNLSYVHETGRTSVMELLAAIIAKFQAGLVAEYSDLVFVALVMVIANDDSTKCREMAGQIIKSLFNRLDAEHRRSLFVHLHSWASQSTRPELVRVALQVYGLLVDAMEVDYKTYLKATLQDVDSALSRSADAFEESQANDGEEAGVEQWQMPYHGMTLLCKLIRVFPDLVGDVGGKGKGTESIQWKYVVAHLLFPHTWTRKAACRLIGSLYSAVPPKAPATSVEDNPDHPLTSLGMQIVVRKLCVQLNSENLDDDLGLQIVKNLFYIGKCFALVDEAVGDDGEDDSGSDSDEEAVGDAAHVGYPLPWMFSKLSYRSRSVLIAMNKGRQNTASCNPAVFSRQLSCIVRWFAAMTNHMEASQVEKYLVHILNPVYRIAQLETVDESFGKCDTKNLATELQDLVQTKVGPTRFTVVYNEIRQGVFEVRQERKTKLATLAVTNPDVLAKRKLHKNSIKKESRKRKKEDFA